jgi:hypothetical protein
MLNHWHLVLYPRADGDLSQFLRRITLTHTQCYHAKTRTVRYGHVYQGGKGCQRGGKGKGVRYPSTNQEPTAQPGRRGRPCACPPPGPIWPPIGHPRGA